MKRMDFNEYGYRSDHVDVIDVIELTPELFREKYWKSNTPLLIKRGIKHWPANIKWREVSYILNEVGDTSIGIRDKTLGEFKGGQDKAKKMQFSEFCKKVNNPSNAPIWIHAINILRDNSRKSDKTAFSQKKVGFRAKISRLAQQDFGGFPFLKNEKPSKRYPSWRIFMYKNSLTDWHIHALDSHFMCQVVGDKEVFLLPPNQGFKVIDPIVTNKKVRSYEATESEQLKIKKSKPIRVVVEDGDVLHIPILWHHTVRPLEGDSSFGVTTAYAFASPLRVSGDTRLLKNKLLHATLPSLLKPVAWYARFLARLAKNKPLFVD